MKSINNIKFKIILLKYESILFLWKFLNSFN
jgi:hypothetical protein